ncbi:hypothetical protein PMZ80_001987 [Knufia obscura]|uniref:Uncharacterized protein n=1 Tax=Knufia obscura TaxID=1635080 RepID=A0ABR0RW16_9EURO|nr:hypothetical protein PMZ80_001987 [Knufia obscura]
MTSTALGTAFDTLATIFGVGVDLASIFSKPPGTPSNIVTIYTGEQDPRNVSSEVDLGKSIGGDAPGVTVWDGVGHLIGTSAEEGQIGVGSSAQYSFESGDDKRAGQYVSVSAGGTDGVCIAVVTLNTASGNDYAWFGDVGRLCGVPWYYSSAIFATRVPACVWIDTNGDKGHKYNGFSIHMPSFWDKNREPEAAKARQAQWDQRPELMCKSNPRFTMWDDIVPDNDVPMFLDVLQMTDGPDTERDQTAVLDPINWDVTETGEITGPIPKAKDGSACFAHPDDCHPSGPSAEENLKLNDPVDATRRRRGLRRRQEITARIMPDDLRISSFPEHSAKQLCEDAVSEGPDFVSLTEGLFCDMSTLDNRKQLYPLCSTSLETNCFEMDTYTIRGIGAGTTAPYPTNTTAAGLTLGPTTAVAHVAAAVSSVPSKAYTNVQTWG